MRIITIYFLLISTYLFISCDENKPVIPCLSCDMDITMPTPDSVIKKVLLEEFTGVRCVNCPQAQSEIRNLQSASVFGDRLIAISYHAGFFSEPYSDSRFDFRTAAGTTVLNFLETPIGYPSGVINRRQFSGQRGLQVVQFAAWGGLVEQALAEEATLSLTIGNTYNADNRQLEVMIAMMPLVELTDDLNLTVLIIEEGIADIQLTPDGLVEDYTQSHVFRTTLTNTLGNPITETLNAGSTIANNFSFVLPPEWVAENCAVVAFVHQVGAEKMVLQVEEKGVL